MGISRVDIELLIRLRAEGHLPDRARVIELGPQQLSHNLLRSREVIAELGRSFGVEAESSVPAPDSPPTFDGIEERLAPDAPMARDLWRWLGFEYASIDIHGSPGSIPLDLNYDEVPQAERNKYEIVTNYGTTERVANQMNAFKIIHDLAAVRGIMVHHVPAQGNFNHGMVNYNPKFFWLLACSNNYRWLYFDFTTSGVSSLAHGGVYRATAWVKAEPGVRVMIEARDAVDPLTGKPSNYGVARADLAARSIVDSTGDILASGVEAAGDGWEKVWVDLRSRDGQLFVTIGLLEGPNNRHVFNAAGQEVTFGGFEISPTRPVQTSSQAGLPKRATNVGELPPLSESPFGPARWDLIDGLTAEVVEGSAVVPGQRILRLVAVGADGRHALGARFGGLAPDEFPPNVIDAVEAWSPDVVARLREYKLANANLIVVVQKTRDARYVAPLDVPAGTSTTTNVETLLERYPTIYNPGP